MPTSTTRSDKSKRSVLGNLKADEALHVLHRLLATHPNLKKEAEGIARSLLGEVNFKEIADQVQSAVSALDFDDLNARAGHHEQGYVEPGEAAWEILDQALEPFTADIQRRIELVWRQMLWRSARGRCSGFTEWVTRALALWRNGHPTFQPKQRATPSTLGFRPRQGKRLTSLGGSELSENAPRSRRSSLIERFPNGPR